MGGGGLVILPKKSWNVWNQDNLSRVRRDEKEHQLEIDAKKKRRLELEAKYRYKSLSKGKTASALSTDEIETAIDAELEQWDATEYIQQLRAERMDESELKEEPRVRKRKRREMESRQLEKSVRSGRMEDVRSQMRKRRRETKAESSAKHSATSSSTAIAEMQRRDVDSTAVGKSSLERKRLREQPWYCASHKKSKRRRKLERTGVRGDKHKSSSELQKTIDAKKLSEDPLAEMQALLRMTQ